MSLPHWDEEEIAGLSGHLKDSIINSIEYQKEIRQRLEYLELVSGMDPDYLSPEEKT